MVGANIKRNRLAAGATEAMVAAHLGCTTEEVAAMEAGELRPAAAVLYELAVFLRCGVGSFFLQN